MRNGRGHSDEIVGQNEELHWVANMQIFVISCSFPSPNMMGGGSFVPSCYALKLSEHLVSMAEVGGVGRDTPPFLPESKMQPQ